MNFLTILLIVLRYFENAKTSSKLQSRIFFFSSLANLPFRIKKSRVAIHFQMNLSQIYLYHSTMCVHLDFFTCISNLDLQSIKADCVNILHLKYIYTFL
jgi:hypothetical protein